MRSLAVWLLSVSSPLERDLLQLDRPLNASLPLQPRHSSLDAVDSLPAEARGWSDSPMRCQPHYPLTSALNTTMRSAENASLASTPERRRVSNLFGNFMFKGIGISILKSLNSWQSCAFRFFIPITQNFPEYDRRVTLPRVVLHTAVFHPFEYRLSLAVSVPLHIALYGLSRGLEGRVTTPELSRRIRRTRATASVKRVGVTFSLVYRMYSKQRMLFSVGPWLFFLPGPSIVDRLLTLQTFLSTLLHSLQLYLQKWMEDRTTFTTSQNHNITESRNGTLDVHVHSLERRAIERRILTILLRYFHSKSPGLGYNFGWTRTGQSSSFGTVAIFEMQYFYPLLEELRVIRRLFTSSMKHPE